MLLAKQIFIAKDLEFNLHVFFDKKEDAVDFVVQTMEDGKETFELFVAVMYNNDDYMITGKL